MWVWSLNVSLSKYLLSSLSNKPWLSFLKLNFKQGFLLILMLWGNVLIFYYCTRTKHVCLKDHTYIRYLRWRNTENDQNEICFQGFYFRHISVEINFWRFCHDHLSLLYWVLCKSRCCCDDKNTPLHLSRGWKTALCFCFTVLYYSENLSPSVTIYTIFSISRFLLGSCLKASDRTCVGVIVSYWGLKILSSRHQTG